MSNDVKYLQVFTCTWSYRGQISTAISEKICYAELGVMIVNRRIFLMAFLMTIVIPGFVYGKFSKWEDTVTIQETVVPPELELISISVLKNGKLIELKLEAYVQCVILGEIPADFETEALKAQAVATRTYTMRNVQKTNKHEFGVLCADPSCCQAFCTPDEYLSRGGSAAYITRIQEAVEQTAGEVLLYDGALAEATYFAASGGRTEAAVNVWGKDVPYLQSVISNGEQAEEYENKYYTFTRKAFLEKLGLPAELSEEITCTSILYTQGKGVDTITICGTVYTGKEMRERLKLPSTVFQIAIEDDRIDIIVDGNGHRVGMSQYGADAMAVQGNTYQEILNHYYPGTELHPMTEEEMKAVFDKAGNL